MSTEKTIIYDTADQNSFIHNADEVLIDGAGATFKKLTLSGDSTFVATAYDGADADRAIDPVVTPVNGAVITNQRYDLSVPLAGKSFDFNGSNFPATQQVTVRGKFTPDYVGTPASNRFFLEGLPVSGVNNSITLFHQAAGSIQLRVTSSTGGVSVQNFAGWVAVQGQEYELELNMDFDSAAGTRLFIDGIQLDSVKNTLMTRGSIDKFRLGSSGTGTSQFFVRDVEIFNSIKHTVNFPLETPRVVPIYPYESNVEPTEFSVAEGFDLLADINGSNYYMKIENSYYYLLVGVLTASNLTLAQSNSAAEWNLNAVVVTAFISTGARITPIVVLESNGLDNVLLPSTTLTYDFFALPVSCDVCTLYGFVKDNCADIVSGTVRVYVKKPFLTQGNLASFDDTVDIRLPNGYFEVPLVIPDAGDLYFFEAKWVDSDEKNWSYKKKILIPDAATALLTTVIQ